MKFREKIRYFDKVPWAHLPPARLSEMLTLRDSLLCATVQNSDILLYCLQNRRTDSPEIAREPSSIGSLVQAN